MTSTFWTPDHTLPGRQVLAALRADHIPSAMMMIFSKQNADKMHIIWKRYMNIKLLDTSVTLDVLYLRGTLENEKNKDQDVLRILHRGKKIMLQAGKIRHPTVFPLH
jgi:hypothetical protein